MESEIDFEINDWKLTIDVKSIFENHLIPILLLQQQGEKT